MFEEPNWSDTEDGPPTIKKKTSSSSLSSLTEVGSKKLKTFASSVKKKVDKCINSPGMSRKLITEDDDDFELAPPKSKKMKRSNSSSSEIGSILRKGIKFSSESEFIQFMSGKSKKKKQEKPQGSPSKNEEKLHVNGEGDQLKTDAKPCKFDVKKIKEMLATQSSQENPPMPMSDQKLKLKSAQFRHLNEQLYTQSGSQSLKMFKRDPEAFKVYHEGFKSQAEKWPVDPLNLITAAIIKMSGKLVVADFGCGEARLAKALKDIATVHSFDLVKLNDYVTVCDFANTPLEDESCDVVVFCLSLMGTNLKDFLKEANRVLKTGGTMKIAEVVSRFKSFPLDDFIQTVGNYGFQVKWKDTKSDYFYLMDFKRVSRCKKKPPELSLKPCLYKKR